MISSRTRIRDPCHRLTRCRNNSVNRRQSQTQPASAKAVSFNPFLTSTLMMLLIALLAPDFGSGFVVPSTTATSALPSSLTLDRSSSSSSSSSSSRSRSRCSRSTFNAVWGGRQQRNKCRRMLLPPAATESRSKLLRSETRRHAWQGVNDGLADTANATTELHVENLIFVPPQEPERPPFDLDAAVFLAGFAFEAYREPGRVAWEVPGSNSVLFKKGEYVPQVFPGLLTVSLVGAEGLPTVLEPVGSDGGTRERDINPSVAMVLADKDMKSGAMKSVKRPLPGGRCWGELFSMHVHHPESSVLEVGLLDKGEEGTIPLPVTGVFRKGEQLVGTARVPLYKILRGMMDGRDEFWTGWVEIDPIVLSQEEQQQQLMKQQRNGGSDGRLDPATVESRHSSSGDSSAVSTSGKGVATARLHLDLRYSPMERYHGETLPTAPRVTEAEVPKPGTLSTKWKELVRRDGADDAATDVDADAAGAGTALTDDGDIAVFSAGLSSSTSRTFLYKDDDGEGGDGEQRAPSAFTGGCVDGSTAVNSGRKDKENTQDKGKGESMAAAGSSTKGRVGEEGRTPWPWRWGTGEPRNADRTASVPKENSRGRSKDSGKAKAKKGKGKRAAVAEVVLREDGMPDWSVLANRVGGLAQQAESFEPWCFIDNHDTDTQVGLWRDEANKRLVVSFRGTAQFEDVLTDVNFLLDDLDDSSSSATQATPRLPAVDDVVAAVFNTTSSWKKERVQPLPQTLAQQKVYMLQSMSKLLDTSRDLLKDLQDTTKTSEVPIPTAKRLSGRGGSSDPDGTATSAPRELSDTKGGGVDNGTGGGANAGEGVTAVVRPAEEILSGVRRVLRLAGGAEPASAADVADTSVNKHDRGARRGDEVRDNDEGQMMERKTAKPGNAAATAAAAEAATNLIDLLESSNSSVTANSATTAIANRDSGNREIGGVESDRGAVGAAVGTLWKRWKGGGASAREAGNGDAFEKKTRKIPGLMVTSNGDSGETEGGLADTLAWVQQVAGEKIEEMISMQNIVSNETMTQMQLLSDISEGRVNATEGGEIMAQFLREQLEKVEATRELVDRVEEFRDSIAAVGVGWDGNAGGLVGLEALQERVQESGRKAIDDRIDAFQAVLANVTALQLQEQRQWDKDGVDVDIGDDVGGGGAGTVPETTLEAIPSPKIHAGFRRAYSSVNDTLGAVVGSAIGEKPEEWHVYITGHSLGGALATLAALDQRRRHPTTKVTMYNFGSPRVGNRAFAELYDSYVGDSFRVVNNLDAVARMPRASMQGISLDYSHAGRTVMVAEEPEEPPWIQGESGGACPLEETDPVSILTKGSTDFFSREIDFMKALVSGKGIDHHMELNYFAALDSFYDQDGTREA